MRRQLADVLADRDVLVELADDAVAPSLPDVRRVQLDDPVDAVVRRRGLDRLDEPLLLVGEQVAPEEHVRVPEHVREDDGRLARGVEAERALDLLAWDAARPTLVPARQERRVLVVAPGELLLELGVALGRPLELPHALPRRVGERARMDRLRLLGVALEHGRVVLEAADELDHVEAAVQRDVAERSLARVVLLVEEHELGLDVVQDPAGGDRGAHGRVQQLREQRSRLRVVEVDASLVQVPRHGRERLAADLGALVAQLLQVGRARHALVERCGHLSCAVPQLGRQVVLGAEKAMDPEELVVAARDRRVGQRGDDRLEPLQLERLREHALLLRLVRRVASGSRAARLPASSAGSAARRARTAGETRGSHARGPRACGARARSRRSRPRRQYLQPPQMPSLRSAVSRGPATHS